MDWMLEGTHGQIVVQEWPNEQASWLAVLAHGYGEHIGRYAHVAAALQAAGAAVVGPDHEGHGRSAGERAVITDFEDVVADLHQVAQHTAARYVGLPQVLIGHSMGGLIAARYAQRYGGELSALVLSGPMFGAHELVTQLLSLETIPDVPLDPSVLSRDAAVGTAYAADPLVWHGPFQRPMLQAMASALDATAAGPSLGDLPTLWVHGEADQLVPLALTRPLMEQLRGTHFEEHIFAEAQHEVFNEINRDEVLHVVIDFVHRALASAK
ncbi:MAG TPA: alpha/beta fold hydrolase [Herpetosiphonaceae bacterium]